MQNCGCVMPVSYTHLDVYKRQIVIWIFTVWIVTGLKSSAWMGLVKSPGLSLIHISVATGRLGDILAFAKEAPDSESIVQVAVGQIDGVTLLPDGNSTPCAGDLPCRPNHVKTAPLWLAA